MCPLFRGFTVEVMPLYIADGNAKFNMKAPLFTYMAVDFAGPMHVTREKGEEGSKVLFFLPVVLNEPSILNSFVTCQCRLSFEP